jgi:hypothetical protein
MGGALSDLELLAVEVDTLWTRDECGRLAAPAPHLVIAASPEGRLVVAASEVPHELAAELMALASEDALPAAPGEPPAVLDGCAARLAAALGPVAVTGGPSYVATPVPVASSPATLIVSDGSKPHGQELRAPEGAGWEEEWRELLEGRLGPWAMAAVDGEIVAICFSARWARVGAEAGVRTEPAHRGRGHAAAVTAAWASLVMATGRQAFYSTSASNVASQRVAARLGLRPIGWIWQVGRPRA